MKNIRDGRKKKEGKHAETQPYTGKKEMKNRRKQQKDGER